MVMEMGGFLVMEMDGFLVMEMGGFLAQTSPLLNIRLNLTPDTTPDASLCINRWPKSRQFIHWFFLSVFWLFVHSFFLLIMPPLISWSCLTESCLPVYLYASHLDGCSWSKSSRARIVGDRRPLALNLSTLRICIMMTSGSSEVIWAISCHVTHSSNLSK